jgi:hypothetical protein
LLVRSCCPWPQLLRCFVHQGHAVFLSRPLSCDPLIGPAHIPPIKHPALATTPSCLPPKLPLRLAVAIFPQVQKLQAPHQPSAAAFAALLEERIRAACPSSLAVTLRHYRAVHQALHRGGGRPVSALVDDVMQVSRPPDSSSLRQQPWRRQPAADSGAWSEAVYATCMPACSGVCQG